jgi:hypothetical protein
MNEKPEPTHGGLASWMDYAHATRYFGRISRGEHENCRERIAKIE